MEVQPFMFIGRERELASLERLYKSDKFEFAVVYGRRRVGKTANSNLSDLYNRSREASSRSLPININGCTSINYNVACSHTLVNYVLVIYTLVIYTLVIYN